MCSMDLRTEQRQSQTLSPRLQHAVRLLQMSSLDFGVLVRDALGSNPFLEPDEHDADGADAELDNADALAADAGNEDGEAAGENDRDLWWADGPSGVRRGEEGDHSAMEAMAVETSLNAHLHGQLNVLPLSPRDLALARTIVESLDDDGYLRTELDELMAFAALNPAVTLQEMRTALHRVQALEPAGIAARSVAECLQLQLPAITCPELRSLATVIVSDHLQALAARDISGLARKLGQTPAKIEAVCDRIRRLDPRPGWRHGSTQVDYVVPDVIVRKHRDRWAVQLNPAIVPRVRLNHVYADLFQRHRSAQNSELADHLQEARWTMRNVEQRFSTILAVSESIVRRQRHFLEFGNMAMKPLCLREVAEEVGVHESTVSRVTNNKYMATPSGVYELKYFFSRPMVSSNGSACSGTAIRGLVQDMIAAEAPDAPLSDAEITRQLAQQGLVVARRTVTKYRQTLRIEAVDRRRRHAAA